jgi:hypothetical protein
LGLHKESEEAYFYPRLRLDEAAREIALEAYEEHRLMDQLGQQITDVKPKDEASRPKVNVLKLIAEHHVDEEEREP